MGRVRGYARLCCAAGVAVPGLALAAAGLVHPSGLSGATAHMWWTLHVWLLPVFPLLGLVLVVLVRGAGHDPFAWIARVAAYVYACFYTGLDVLAGIGAGRAYEAEGGPSASVGSLLTLGGALGDVGAWAFLVGTVATALTLLRGRGLRALPGGVVLIGAAVPFLHAHIFWPVGVLSMLGVAVGAALCEGLGGRSMRDQNATADQGFASR